MHLKIVLFLIGLHFYGMAQEMKTNFRDDSSSFSIFSSEKPQNIPSKATVLYSNDFVTPAQWSFTNASVPSANWQLTTNLNLAPFAAFHPAGFTTAFNGYAIIDSDAQGAAAEQDALLTLNQRISACAAEPYVLLRFSQMYRRFNDTTTVEVSNNGTTWTEFEVNENRLNNTNSTNPELVTVNISSAAGNQDSVYIRFRYRASNAWFWAIDDIKILRQDEYDLAGEELIYGTLGNWGSKIPYTKVPQSQLQPVKISGKIKNAGFSSQSDAQLEANGIGFNATSNSIPIPANLTAILDINQDWTPTNSLGNKTINMQVTSSAQDAEPSNDALKTLKLEVTEHIYARDESVKEGRISNNFNAIGFETGNIFDIFSDETLTSAQVYVLAETTPNSTLFVKIYEAIGPNNFVYLSGSDTLLIPSMTTDKWFRVRMQQPELLQSGKSYLLVAGSSGNPVFPGLVMGTAGLSPALTTFYHTNTSINWFDFTEVPMVRMNFESVLATESLATRYAGMELYPNPVEEELSLIFELNQEEILELSILDAQGRVVHVEPIQGKVGKNNLDVSVKALNQGSYTVRLKGSSRYESKGLVKIN